MSVISRKIETVTIVNFNKDVDNFLSLNLVFMLYIYCLAKNPAVNHGHIYITNVLYF